MIHDSNSTLLESKKICHQAVPVFLERESKSILDTRQCFNVYCWHWLCHIFYFSSHSDYIWITNLFIVYTHNLDYTLNHFNYMYYKYNYDSYMIYRYSQFTWWLCKKKLYLQNGLRFKLPENECDQFRGILLVFRDLLTDQ